MPTRQPDSGHEAETNQPTPPHSPQARVESPSEDRMRGANGLPHHPDDQENPAGDQDIDTAGTDIDEDSPAKAVGTGIADSRSRG
jgi:hypothetical protein